MNIDETSKPNNKYRVTKKLKYESITKCNYSDNDCNNTWREQAVEPDLKALLQQQSHNVDIVQNKIILPDSPTFIII